jgi:4-hydroxy-tetrahydrodipicolinate reductase
MIKIILNGCSGKMGKVVSESIKNFPTLSIVAGIDKFNSTATAFPVFSNILDCNVDGNVLLDFSRPDSLQNILEFGKKNKMPLVLCTTGFSEEQLAMISDFSKIIPIFRSANMSLGINVINNILKKVSRMLYDDFDIEIIEKHHNQKVDSPSGTALLLANTIKASIPEDTILVNGREGIAKREHKEIGIHSIRGGGIVGDHEIIFAGLGETIEIKHSAISREVFAIGALKACTFIYGKSPDLYSMEDMIN